jgi:hypothetical protein
MYRCETTIYMKVKIYATNAANKYSHDFVVISNGRNVKKGYKHGTWFVKRKTVTLVRRKFCLFFYRYETWWY